MSAPNPQVMDFLLTRRSRPAKILRLPVPTAEELRPILTAAARVPDHGKLEPWRFLVLEKPALTRLADLARSRGASLGLDPDRIEKSALQFADADLVVAVVMVPRPTEKVPAVEQLLSAGGVCLTLVNAALASGWGASWLTGWPSHDATFCQEGYGLLKGEAIAGLIHIGTETTTPPDRPRPDIDAITTWVRE